MATTLDPAIDGSSTIQPARQANRPATGGEHKRTLKVPLRTKLLVGFTLLFGVVFAGTFYWFYSYSKATAEATIKTALTDSLNGAVAGEDSQRFVGLGRDGKANAGGGSDDPRYQQELDWLATVHSLDSHAYAYDYIGDPTSADGKTVIAIADYWQRVDPARALKFREAWHSNSGLSARGLTELTYHLTPYTDEWGKWVSAYAPMKDSAGQTVGAMGVDYRAEYVDQVQQTVRNQLLVAFVVIYILLFSLIFVVSRVLSNPIRVLTRAALRIGEGDYNQDLSVLRRGWLQDEITSLAEVFEAMVAKVSTREQTLVRKVEELRIEIDQAKRAKDVSEIVDSDSFSDLQAKARLLRARKQDKSRVGD